jgi:hypothetical protein
MVDSATAITSMSAVSAAELLIPFPRTTINLSVRTAAGRDRQVRHPGYITVRIPGMEGREFRWPCHFVQQHWPSPGATQGKRSVHALLGLAGVLDDLRILLDGSYAFDAPHGCVILEELASRRSP